MTITSETNNILKERMSRLPAPLLDLLNSKLDNFVKKIAEKNNLSGFVPTKIANEIVFVLLALEPLEDLALNLKNNADVGTEVADVIAAATITEFLGDYAEQLIVENIDDEEDLVIDAALEQTEENTNTLQTPLSTAKLENPPQNSQAIPNINPASEATAPVPESTVQPLRTMENDMDKIHGYGAYRKMYPDPQVESAIPNGPESAGGEEGVVRATSQDEMLKKRSTLTETPTYDERE